MTTHLQPNPTLQAFPIHIEINGRRAYGARLNGPDKRYGIEREFCQKRYSIQGRRGLWAVIRTAGWYETVTYSVGIGRRSAAYWAVTSQGELDELGPALAARWITTAITGPAPGNPGAWWGDRCPCGNPAEEYTSQLWPRCPECPKEETR